MTPTPAPGTAVTVEFRRVTKHYDATAMRRGAPGAVNDLSLTVPAGKTLVLVGPSGCGKTTSLKMVNRLIEPTSGQILIDGVDVTTRPATKLRRGIGYVIQQVGLFPHQTVAENVATVPRLLGWPKARQGERAEELLGLVGLDPGIYARRYPAQLSGGERQRVGVARASRLARVHSGSPVRDKPRNWGTRRRLDHLASYLAPSPGRVRPDPPS